ncbi:hypothetical protein AVDCRST_MAG94-4325, partial [uncultured Leptolyngbya sp.]
SDQLLARKRALVGTIIDQLKNISQLFALACRRQTFTSP